MRCAVVRTFIVMLIIGVFRHEILEKLLQVAPRGWRGILHHCQTATRVLNKYRYDAVADLALVDLLLDFIRDFVGSLAVRSNFQLFMLHAHLSRLAFGLEVAR